MKQHAATGSILVTDAIAMNALSVLLKRKAGEIEKAFPAFFVQEIVNAVEEYKPKELPKWITSETQAIVPLGDGGILNGLWELCEELSMGCEVVLKQIPIRQECVEVCELFEINPLYASSAGSMLIATDHGYELKWMLEKAGIDASIIGVLKKGADRVILSGENNSHVRHLDRPQKEELLKVL